MIMQKSYSRANRFLYDGYTYAQEMEWKEKREELREEEERR